MEPGRFVLPPARWDTNSALANYPAIRDPEFRIGGAFGGRGFPDGKFPRETGFPREPFHRDITLEREAFPLAPPIMGLWPPRRRSLEEELAIIRGTHRQDKVGFIENFRDIDSYREIENFRDADNFRDISSYRDIEGYHDIDNFREADGRRDYGLYRISRFPGRDRDNYAGDDYDRDYRSQVLHGSREGSRELDYEYSGHADYDSDHDRKRRDRDRRRHKERDRERRGRSGERGRSPDRDRRRERSRSYSHDEWGRRSHSPSSHSRSKRDGSHEEARHESRSEKRRDRDEKHHHDRPVVAPSATLVVRGLSQKTVEDDLYQALTQWGPLRHVRVIKERSSGISRGFAFVDFPSLEAAQKMMEGIGEDGLVLDGRRVFFEYSSKPTGGVGAPQAGPGGSTRTGASGVAKINASAPAANAVDWMCTVCGCVNFARRTSCFQCNEGRSDDAPSADVPVSASAPTGKKGSEAGPTHVLVVRGLDEHVNEEMLHYEFSKYAPIKDLRLVRDKFTHVSRGFAFIHFHSVEEATKALDASNGTALEKNGQLLRVAYAKSIHGPGSNSSSTPPASSLAAAAIEAATFAQQYDSAGWAPKEYAEGAGGHSSNDANGAPQSGFVWDEASGYYFDAASGFYYDYHRGLFYDGNNAVWYSYDQETQQYVPYIEPSGADTSTDKAVESTNPVTSSGDGVMEKTIKTTEEGTNGSKVVISAPAAATDVEQEEKKPTLAEAVQAAAAAAQAATKKDRERMKEKEKEIRLASKGLLLASKKRISNAVNLWKQRQNEGSGATLMSVDDTPPPSTNVSLRDDKQENNTASTGVPGTVSSEMHAISKKVEGVTYSKEGSGRGPGPGWGAGGIPFGGSYTPSESHASVRQVSSTSLNAVTVDGKGTGRGMGRAEAMTIGAASQPYSIEGLPNVTPFKTDASALGSYGPMAGARRRFTEAPNTVYRDRAAERRSLYGSSSVRDESLLELDMKDRGAGARGRGLDMPFPPGVGGKGGGSVLGGPETQAYEVITSEKAIDERNVGNRMLRNMGWQEGSGLGKDGSGIVEPVQAQTTGERAGLGSQAQHRKVDSRFETQPGDSYRVVIQKKALARFHEMK